MSESLEPVTRPNGKAYRPRKVRSVVFEDDGPRRPWRVLVLGTHDTAFAARVARQRAAEADPDIRLNGGRRGWWRESIRDGDLFWEWNDVTGAAGVMFEEDAACDHVRAR